ncbi:hypothetical protein ACFFNY_35640 [Paenibacillus hodogayensis]|uniref:Uncharacterized protein n=1 Tax=Paenibacillus hodogayensis TaxID=279208 RepID=A0ABV5W8M3_9BACL
MLAEMEGSASMDESLELFEMVSDAVISDPDAFPTISSDAYKHGVRPSEAGFSLRLAHPLASSEGE